MEFLILLAVSLCTAAISFTITTTSMFTWLRELVSPIHPKIEELIHCPWCLGHWITFIILGTSNVKLLMVSDYTFYNFMFTAFTCIAMSGIIHYVLLRAYESIPKLALQRKLNKLG